VSLIDLLCSYRTLRDRVISQESSVIKDIMSNEPSRNLIFPCDIIDLRKIFGSQLVTGKFPILLFSLRFAQKYLKDYSVFLTIDSEKILDNKKKNGSILVIDTDTINIQNIISRIIINNTSNPLYFEQVRKLVKEYKIGAECLISNTVPGVESQSLILSHNKKKIIKTSQKTPQIILNNDEKQIFDLIIQAKKYSGLPIKLLCAGGWVRDHLLGLPSDDIDIAVNAPGYSVALAIKEYGDKYHIQTISNPHRVSLEKTNDPIKKEEQSDKLMVGGIDIMGKKIEFVPMRTESYPDPNSRTPVITNTNDPREDSKRRDLSINAIYYNIETQQVEDYVGGIKDLGLNNTPMLLRTPDDPVKTFTEDPLRVLRTLRFHSRYPKSIISPDVIEAMRNPLIHQAYKNKVSSERAGKEIMKMVTSEDPVSALKLLFDTDMYKAVFNVSSMEDIVPEGIKMDQQTPHHDKNLLDHTLAVVSNLNTIMKQNNESDYMRGLLNFAALFHDFGKMKKDIPTPHPKNPNQMQYLEHEDASTSMADDILKSIGIGKDDRDIVSQIIKYHMKPHNADEWSNKAKGRFLRDTKLPGKEEEHKDLWKYIMYHVQADQMAGKPGKHDPEKFKQVFDSLQSFVQSPAGSSPKPIIDGNEIMKLFPQLKPATGYIKEIQQKIIEMQDSGEINMNYINMPEGPERKNLEQVAKNQALEAIKLMGPQIIEKYKETPKMSKNWFKSVVGQSIPIGLSPGQKDPEIIKGPKIQPSSYEVGMIVRDRRKGIANPQKHGKIVSIKGNAITIEWEPKNSKEKKIKQVLDLVEDTHLLSLIVAEV